MVSRTSLRKKLAYTFLAGALITVLLFSLTIEGILTEYFRRQSDARLQFVQDQLLEAVRANLTIFKDRLQQMQAAGGTALNSISRSGAMGDRFPQLSRPGGERDATIRILQGIQTDAKLSLITLVDLKGRVVIRSTNPSAYGDDTLMQDYENSGGPVSSVRKLMLSALEGKTVNAFEVFAPEILAPENFQENGKVVSSLKDYAAIPLRGRDLPTGTVESRVLVLASARPILNSQGKIVGGMISGRVINKDLSIVQDVRNLLQDQATIFLGQVRIATTLKANNGKGESLLGTLHPSQTRTSIGLYSERKSRGPMGGEELMGVFDPIQDYEGVAVGSLYLGRPLSSMAEIATAQEEIESAIQKRSTLYIIALAVFSVLLAVFIGTIFSKRITERIDQLRKGAETISNGSLDYRLKIESGDEIEVLAEQFNSMAARLHESYQTLEKKVEERTRQLRQSQEAMIQQEKMVGIGQLAAGIAHEMNTPLGTIIGYAQMLREDLAEQPSVNGSLNDVDEIIGQAGRCRDLVKNLLNFSRVSTTEKSQADINEIVRKIVSLVEHDSEMKRVHVRVSLDPKIPKAHVNENEIAQVMLNLANNAVDSMPDGGDLNVTTFYEDETDRIRIEVHDTGLGINESDRTRVFEPFFTTKEVGKGTGLGLSICYKIVENHLGTMEFDSVIGRGTTFRVYIPVSAEVRVV